MNNIKLFPSLLVFSEVARRESFTKAANALKLSKSAVSQHISRLENAIEMQLLRRNTRGVSTTAIGKKLLARCELLQDQIDLAFVELSNAEQAPSGKFSITLPHGLEKDVGVPALIQLCREFPGLEPEVLISDDKKDLINHQLDVAIYGGEPDDSNYRALPIGTMKEIFCASPNYLQRRGTPESFEGLLQHDWIATSWQSTPASVFEDTPQASKELLPLRVYAKANTLPCVVEMALQHLGFVLLPDIVANRLIQSGKLVRILESSRGSLWPFYFIHPFQNEKPLHITRFHQLVTHFFAKSVTSVDIAV